MSEWDTLSYPLFFQAYLERSKHIILLELRDRREL
jgi:hypothetical protein